MEHKLSYHRPAEYFEEALPLGNGTMGAMVYGGIAKERISLNHESLWSGKPRTYLRPNAKEAHQKAKELIALGDTRSATELLEREFTAPFGETYLPLGNLWLETDWEGEVEGYLRRLDLERGLVEVSYNQGGVSFTRTCFVSHPDGGLVLRVESDRPCSYRLTADSSLKSATTAYKGCLYLSGEAPSSISPSYAKGIVPTVYNNEGMQFTAVGCAVSNGEISHSDTHLLVKNATDVTLVLRAETSFVSYDMPPNRPCYASCEAFAREMAKMDYVSLLERHVSDHSALYNRVRLELNCPVASTDTDLRLARGDDTPDLGLVELLFHFGRYLVIASSREECMATNLQGIWNEEIYPPWSSNYTVNINTQMNYWPVLPCNLPGLDLPLTRLIETISQSGREIARKYYGAEGYCAHHNVDLWGLASPVGAGRRGVLGYAFWSLSAGWLCRHLWEHYEYTCDEAYLREKAYPLMRGAAEFYLSILTFNGSHWVLSPTTSPENSYLSEKNERFFIAAHTAMTQGILMDLFGNLLHASEVLGIDDSFTRELKEKLPLMNNYQIGSDGQLLEYDRDYTEFDQHHRHISHLYGLYPAEQITLASTPELANACRRSLERRGDTSPGWSMAWKSCLWSKLKDGDRALQLILGQLRLSEPPGKGVGTSAGTCPNLFGAYPPFQIDSNFGITTAVSLMLLQCEDGKLRLLPALPRAYPRGSVKGLKAKGNVTVDMEWAEGRLISYTLESPLEQRVTVATHVGDRVIELAPNQPITVELD